MKKNFILAAMFVAFCVFMGNAAISFGQVGTVTGGYSPVAKDDQSDAAVAAVLAVQTRAKKDRSLKLVSIERAERQIVAGSNYRLCLGVDSHNKRREAMAVVYQNLRGKMSLTSWTIGKCAATAKSADVSAAADNSHPDNKITAKKGTIEHLAQTVSAFFEEGTLNRLDTQKPYLNSVEIVIVDTLSDGRTSRRFKTLGAGERWFRATRKQANFEGNNFENCAKGVCTFTGGILHNTLFLSEITYTVVKGRPLIKKISFIDGN